MSYIKGGFCEIPIDWDNQSYDEFYDILEDMKGYDNSTNKNSRKED